MKIVIIAVIVVILVVAIGALLVTPEKEIVSDTSTITNFEECIAAGNPAMESYPRQCRTPDGKHFVESIPEQEKPTVCTLQWEPMCGVDGETYGNLCMLDASDVKLDYEGECVIAEPEPAFDSKEHYAIEITGLKDVYIVGERYDFSYILSGYGHPCGGKTVTFPDSNGDTIGSASSASCIANLPMGIFVFDIQKERGTTYGHVGIKNSGTYTVTITFDSPSQNFPTTVSKEFRVIEK